MGSVGSLYLDFTVAVCQCLSWANIVLELQFNAGWGIVLFRDFIPYVNASFWTVNKVFSQGLLQLKSLQRTKWFTFTCSVIVSNEPDIVHSVIHSRALRQWKSDILNSSPFQSNYDSWNQRTIQVNLHHFNHSSLCLIRASNLCRNCALFLQFHDCPFQPDDDWWSLRKHINHTIMPHIVSHVVKRQSFDSKCRHAESWQMSTKLLPAMGVKEHSDRLAAEQSSCTSSRDQAHQTTPAVVRRHAGRSVRP